MTVLKKLVKRAAISTAASVNLLPHGINLVADLRRRIPDLRHETIFDVGANTGQSIAEFRANYSSAKILSFEPDPDTFAKLKAAYGNRIHISLYNLAFGETVGKFRFDNTSPISEIHAISKDQSNTMLPLVEVTTIDQFCSGHGINQISFLKIDTEGNDINVIRGASSMLHNGRIGVVSAECSLMQQSRRLVSFSDLQTTMREYGYVCFGIYEQSFGSLSPDHLEINFANCAFVRR